MADGTRTHDDQNHNLGLYQLSYSHRRAYDYSVKTRRFGETNLERAQKATFHPATADLPGAAASGMLTEPSDLS